MLVLLPFWVALLAAALCLALACVPQRELACALRQEPMRLVVAAAAVASTVLTVVEARANP